MAIANLLNQSVTIYAKAVRNRYGKTTFDSGTLYAARFEQTNKTISTVQSDKEPIDGVVFLNSDCVVDVGDKVVYNSQDYRVLRRSNVPGANGKTHHVELMVQLWSL